MAVAVRATYPSGTTTATTAGSGNTSITTASVSTLAGDSLEVHTVVNAATDTGITISSATFNGVAADGIIGPIHSNGQTAGYEIVSYWKNPGAVTGSVVVTANTAPDGWEQKCIVLSGVDGNIPTSTTFAPSGTGTTTAAAITSPTIASGGIGLGHFCAGSAFSAVNQTQLCIAQNGATDAANSIATNSVAGTGSTVSLTATISAGDWYAAIATAWAPAAPNDTGFIMQEDGTSKILLEDGSGAITGEHYVPPATQTASPSAIASSEAFGILTLTDSNVRPSAIASGEAFGTSKLRLMTYMFAGQDYFTDGSGHPQLMVCGEDWGMLANAGLNHAGSFTATYDDYLTTKHNQGYTVIEVSWASFKGMSGAPNGADSDGAFPFATSMDPTTTANSTFWSRRDYFFAAADALNMKVICNLTTPYLDFGSPNTPPQASWTNAQWTAFGNFVGARYANQANVMWIVGDDYQTNGFDTQLGLLRTALRNQGANQPFTVQYSQGSTSRSGVNGGAKNLHAYADWNHGYSYTQAYEVTEWAATNDNGYQATTPIPYWWADGYFLPGATTASGHRRILHRHIWWALSSASRGFVIGDDDCWPWPSTALARLTSEPFFTSIVPAIASYFTSLPNWHKLKTSTGSAFITSGRGTHRPAGNETAFYGSGGTGSGDGPDDDTYVSASITADGTLAVIYSIQPMNITIDQTKMGSGYTATWVDPVSLATSSATPGSTYNSTSKGNNSDGYNEWVLVLQSTNPLPTTITCGPSAIASAEAVGSPIVSNLTTVAPTGTASAEAEGTPTIATLLSVTPTGVASAGALGTPILSTLVAASPTGVASVEAFGSPTLQPTLAVAPAAIASAQAMGTPVASLLVALLPGAIASAESMGTPSLSTVVTCLPTGVGSAEALGSPSLSMVVTSSPTGLASAEAFGTPSAAGQGTTGPSSIASGEAVGTPTLTTVIRADMLGIAPKQWVNLETNPAMVGGSGSTMPPGYNKFPGTGNTGVYNVITSPWDATRQAIQMQIGTTGADTRIIGQQVKCMPGQTVTFLMRYQGPGRCNQLILWTDIHGAFVSSTSKTPTPDANGWTYLTATVPANVYGAGPQLYCATSDVAGDTHVFSQWLMVHGAYTGPYFDGDSVPSGDDTYAWKAVANASVSAWNVNTLVGTPTLNPVITPQPVGIASAEAEGAPTISTVVGIVPTGVASALAFGVPSLSGGLSTSPTGIASAVAMGNPSVSTFLVVGPSGIASAFAAGLITVLPQVGVASVGIATQQAFGVVVININVTGLNHGATDPRAVWTHTQGGQGVLKPGHATGTLRGGDTSGTKIVQP